ncbi:hypothetical protein C8R43DRAFT_1143298 [Mycena crocata]|nr:hypothetical protein C8R43DRAFT_1143298 [Mycena crocata]
MASQPASDGRVHPINNPLYSNRNASGMLDAFASQIQSMGLSALANLDYPDNITRHVESWNKEQSYRNEKGDELRVAVFGEVGATALGTILRSSGNFYSRSGDTFKRIEDSTKVRDTIALCVPTCATVAVYNTVVNQAIALGQITAADADEDANKGEASSFPFPRHWTKPSVEGRDEHDVLMIHLPPKYSVPAEAGATKTKRTQKRRLDEVDGGTPTTAAQSPTTSGSAVPIPGPDRIKLGAHYDPALLPDFGGELFNLHKAKLVQQDIRNVDNSLVAPWDTYSVLRTGTLILALVTLHCYNMTDTFGKEPKKRRIYQLHAESIRVLDPSDEFVEPRTRPLPPDGLARSTASLPSRAASASFDNFSIPSPSKATTSAETSGGKALASSASQGGEGSSSSAATGAGAGSLDDMMGVEDDGNIKDKRKKRK